MTPKEHRGGKREGAGRKPSGKRKRNYYVTDQEQKRKCGAGTTTATQQDIEKRVQTSAELETCTDQ